ncbi:MAG: nucleotidyltransferase family protein [Gemmatimonadales bacterium]|uniref:nucleotidyltransferase family protein n=1 Tax=Candidatus Palauibacter irciniicola TaxID=3056733 RepID=UPI00137FDC98|nr:nucleotidyltransferase family protein [Candidatus Palauibacter irciniicola]MYC19774.1 nucleotidyltransferase family protein [Gemmatimonadales bacterium]
MSEERRVAGIVLAAGSSTRMGRNKLLLDVGGETLVRRAVRLAGEAGLDPVIPVTGHARRAVERELQDLDCTPIFNPDHEAGIQTSVACGVAAVPAACGAAIVMLSDMPFVTTRMVRTLVERYAETETPLVVSRYGEVNAPPILYGRGLFGEISRMRAGCGREVVRRHHGRAVTVDWPTDRLRDLDRPDEYEAVRREFAAVGSRSGDLP